jgi:hypothetical protein
MERTSQKCIQGDVELDLKDHSLIVNYEIEVVVLLLLLRFVATHHNYILYRFDWMKMEELVQY